MAAVGDVVLKVLPRGHEGDAEFLGEGRALRFWAPTGVVVPLLGVRDDGFSLLLERLRPGLRMDDAPVGEDERLRLLGGLARRLHAAGPPPAGLVTMAESARSWHRALAGTPEQAELDELTAPGPGDRLLHVDLHGSNVLAAGRDWRVIDPHAVVGDPHADVWALIYPGASAPADPAEARRRVELYATAAGLDPDRTAAWTRLRARAEARALDADPTAPPSDRPWATRLHTWAQSLPPRSP